MLLIVLGIVILLVIIFVVMYNGFIRLKNNCDEAFATMDVYLKKRYDPVAYTHLDVYKRQAVVNALLAFKEYLNNGAKDICGSVYDITGQVNVLAESEWPQVETGLIAVPSKTTYTVAESISADDLQVKVIYNSRPATAKVVAYDLTGTNGYKLDYNFGSAGTVSYTHLCIPDRNRG